jgi:hypothetical protein
MNHGTIAALEASTVIFQLGFALFSFFNGMELSS